jgi:coenzyme F420-reducing hydrogenase alpha subunit
MGIEGKLSIVLKTGADNCQATIGSTRPLQTPDIFIGKSVTELLTGIPLLYSVCGTAQGIAAINATEQALGLDSTTDLQAARTILVEIESIREHLWRIELDWRIFATTLSAKPSSQLSLWLPKTRQLLYRGNSPFELDSTIKPDIHELKLLFNEIHQFVTTEIFNQSPEQWLSMKEHDALAYWAFNNQTVAAKAIHALIDDQFRISKLQFLDKIKPKEMAQLLFSDKGAAYAAMPHYQGQCAETTPLARQKNHPLLTSLLNMGGTNLLTRMTARLVELAMLVTGLDKQLDELSLKKSKSYPEITTRCGLAQVEASRGRLIHGLQLDGQLVVNYRIVAPTEWNFHPQGVAKQALEQLKPFDLKQLKTEANLIINAIDPCVAYELKVE